MSEKEFLIMRQNGYLVKYEDKLAETGAFGAGLLYEMFDVSME